jgi:molybdenum cofactor synthesis domain-containing protein
VRTAAILIVGDEVLSGEVADANGPFLVRAFGAAGVTVARIVVVPDHEESIVAELARLLAMADAVVVSGGIGPTHDDVTRPAVARALGVPLETHEEAERLVREIYGSRTTDSELAMARLPSGARLLRGPRLGTIGFAAGPVYVLPGVPSFFQDLALALIGDFRAPPLHREEVVTRRREGEIAPALAAIQTRRDDVRIGSYPIFEDGRWHVRIILRGTDPHLVSLTAREVRAAIR